MALPGSDAEGTVSPEAASERAAAKSGEEAPAPSRDFFAYPGPLFGAVISPSSAVVKVKTERGFRCIARDRSRRPVEEGVEIRWAIVEGDGTLSDDSGEIATFTAPEEPGLTVIEARVTQGDVAVTARALVTSAESLMEKEPGDGEGGAKGLPGYTFLRAPGELWRSRYDAQSNLVVVNNGHRDYVFAAQKHARKLKYICRLFTKELVLANFPGFNSAELLERAIELSLYAEEHLK